MKLKISKKLGPILALVILPLAVAPIAKDGAISIKSPSTGSIENLPKKDVNVDIGDPGVVTDPKTYIGYGYNAVGGKPLYANDALMLNHPILDIENQTLKSKIKVFDGSANTYESKHFTKVSDLAKDYGKVLAGAGGIGGGIAMINVDVAGKFSTGATQAWNTIESEDFSYYSIFSGNRPVVLQMDYDELRPYLTTNFTEDLLAVANGLQARALFEKYGTHLPTGYTLGGIFEMTNYYATSSKTYQRANKTDFKVQVDTALGSYANIHGEYSFTEKYGYLDNTEVSTNQYKCMTYGGATMSGLTIDQAFSWYETAFEAGYKYDTWLKSINQGKNLVIVGIPQSSKMIPLWDLLPVESDHSALKKVLIDTYQEMTAEAYKNYRANNLDHYLKDVSNAVDIRNDFKFVDNGFTYSVVDENNKFSSSKISPESCPASQGYKVKEGGYIYMDYDSFDYVGQDAKWTTNSEGFAVETIDARNGIFRVLPRGGDQRPRDFFVNFSVNGGQTLFTRKFTVSSFAFTGGDGSETSPYLISTIEDFRTFAGNPDYWKEGVHVKLLRDIDLQHEKFGTIGTVDATGSPSTNIYAGVFDGGFYSLKNFTPNADNLAKCIFYSNVGTIKNLTIDYGGQTNSLDINDGSGIVAGLAAFNGSKGRIENCTIRNMVVNYHNKLADKVNEITNQFSAINHELYVAGIAGNSSGIITNCHVIDCSFDVKTEGNFVCSYIGGIAGTAKSPKGTTNGLIEKSMVEKCSFNLDASLSQQYNHKNAKLTMAPIVGFANGIRIDSCVVKDLTLPQNLNNSVNVSYDANKWKNVYISGFAGLTDKANTLQKCIMLNSHKIQDINAVVDSALHSSLFIGKSIVENTYNNVYIQSIDAGAFILNGLKASEIADAQIHVKDKFIRKDYDGTISTSDEWLFDENERPFVNLYRVNYDSLTLDYSLTKTRFIKGETFSYNDLKVTGSYNTGLNFEEDSVYVDSSLFDEMKANGTLGSAVIYVSAFNKTFEYRVEIVDPATDHIYVEQVNNVTYYTGDDNFDPNSVRVHKVTENGIDEVITHDGIGYENGYTYKINNGTFVLGDNVITFTYDNKEFDFHIDAEDRVVRNIAVQDKASLANTVFNVGSKNIDFRDVKVKVSYVDGKEEIKNGNDCEFIYSRIVKGENKIIATYDVVKYDSFTVKGAVIVDQAIIDKFIAAVNAIDMTASLKVQFDQINAAAKIYAKIGDQYEGDKVFLDAKAKYKAAVETYNALINDINSGYQDSVGISTAATITMVSAAGAVGIGVIVTLLIKKFM